MAKIKCLNNISQVGLDLLTPEYSLTEDFTEADAVLVRSAAMHDMEMGDKLSAIARAGAGVNNIPLDKCAEKGIVVFNTPGANANGVKELIVASMIMGSRDLLGGNKWVLDNSSDEAINKTMEKAKSQFAGTEIKGKKLGVIGLGAIGVLVANAAVGLGMEVVGFDPFLSVSNALHLSNSVRIVKSRDDIYKECDYITLHVPALADTKGMICADTIGQMKEGVILLNFSRDLLVNEDDLKEGLESGKIGKYLTDFPTKNVCGMKNVIAFPHLGATTEESEDNCAKMAVSQIRDYMEKGIIRNSVNYPACDPGECDTPCRVVILHRNLPTLLNQFTSVFSKENTNIENMLNKSKGDYAVTVIDSVKKINEDAVKALTDVKDVLRVRVIQ